MWISPNIKKIHSLYESRGYKDNDEVDSDNSNITLRQLKTICSIPLWWKDKDKHLEEARLHPGECCFHHFLGLEEKYGEYKVPHPGLIQIMDDINRYQANVVWKFGGMAVTTTGEYCLPYKGIASFSDNIVDSIIPIIVGPNTYLASEMIEGIRQKFRRKQGIEFAENKYELILPPPNRVKIRIFPSNVHIAAIRGLKRVSYLWFDECDHVSKPQILQMIDAFERYILKNRARLILVSTPNKPDHMLDILSRHYSDTYTIKKYDVWTWGIPHCYTMEEVQAASKRRSFPREFECKFLGAEGNVYMQGEIEWAFSEGLKHCKLHPSVSHFYPNDLENPILQDTAIMQYLTTDWNMPIFPKAMGVDPASGSSAFAITITTVRDKMIHVLYSKHFRRRSESEMVPLIKQLALIYRNMRIFVDGNAASTVIALKDEFHESNRDREYKNMTKMFDREFDSQKIVPVQFKALREKLLEYNHYLCAQKLVRIHPIFRDLRIAMESATARGYDLDKDATTYDDQLDTFCLATMNHEYKVVDSATFNPI